MNIENNMELLAKYNVNYQENVGLIKGLNFTKYSDLVEKYRSYKKPLICCMAGHTLDLQMEKIKKIPKNAYILVVIDQTHQRLVKECLIPDLCFNMDLKDFYKHDFWIETDKTMLVTHTVGNKENFMNWQGGLCFYKSVANTNTVIDHLFNEMQKDDFNDIGTQSCMSTVGLSVMQFCRDTGLPSYWVGLDFGYVDDVRFCDGYAQRLETNAPVHIPDVRLTFDDGRVLNSTKTLISFGGQFLKFLAKNEYKINYCSRGGFFDCINDERYNKYIIKSEFEELL